MLQLAWCTDLHLDFLKPRSIEGFYRKLAEHPAEAFALGGDLAEGPTVAAQLRQFVAAVQRPVYFVLGNHDYYHRGIAVVRHEVGQLAAELPDLHFLTQAGTPLTLSKDLAIVGHDGWADGREGDFHQSSVMLNDYLLIEELASLSKQARLAELFRLGDQAASHVRQQLQLALEQHQHVVVLTHVPPFRNACWHQGQISDDQWAPHFVCQAMGRAILDQALLYPQRQITVLCGHTHSPGQCHPAKNVRVITAGAEYGAPRVAHVLELG